jgi:hypothetical protein
VQFVLEPLYKIYSQAVGEHPASFTRVLAEFGVKLKPKEYKAGLSHVTWRALMSSMFAHSVPFSNQAKVATHAK